MTKIGREALGPRFTKLLHADDGGVAIEYGLLAALIAAGVLIALSSIGESLYGKLSQVTTSLGAPQSASSGGGGSAG